MINTTNSTQGRIRRAASFIVSLVTASTAAVVLTQRNFQAPFGPVDDHEPLRWMGYDGVLTLSEVLPTLIRDTELSNFGEASRFRPSYYLVRVLQTSLFGSHALSWYLSVVFAYVLASVLFGYAISRWASLSVSIITSSRRIHFWVSLIASLLGTFLIVSLHAWSGIVTRLGPSELLAMVGAGLATLSATLLVEGRNPRWWIPLMVGVVTAVFAKEVMLPWGLLPLTIAYRRISLGDSLRRLLLVSMLGIASIAVVLAAVLPPVLRGDSAGYGSIGQESRITLTLQGLFSVYPTYWLPALVALLISFFVFARFWFHRDPRLVRTLLWMILLSIGWFFYDAFIYSGTYELVRYNITWQLVKILWICAAVCFSATAVALGRSLLTRLVTGVALLMSLFLLSSSLTEVPGRMISIKNAAIANAEYAERYQLQVLDLLDAVTESPTAAVIIVQSSRINTEGVRAVEQEVHLRFEGSREVFVVFDPRHPDFNDLMLDLGTSARDSLIGDASSLDLGPKNPRVCVFILSDPGGIDQCSRWPSFRIDA